MEKNMKIYKAIRELICLLCYIDKNLKYQHNCSFLGAYESNKKMYELYTLFFKDYGKSIFIQCENNGMILSVDNQTHILYTNGPIEKRAILNVNCYKDIDSVDNLENMCKENIVYELQVELNHVYYSCINDMCINDNEYSEYDYEQKRYKFNKAKVFDNFLKEEKFLPNMEDRFTPDVVLNLIEQVYSNFEQLYVNYKIEGIISSLSSKELFVLKEKLKEKNAKKLQKSK